LALELIPEAVTPSSDLRALYSVTFIVLIQ
jgi:hypothetical protein